ncbi:MAG: TadE/TadG family type IV pilus assembly protein, partial [Thermoguttaceae bacterium]
MMWQMAAWQRRVAFRDQQHPAQSCGSFSRRGNVLVLTALMMIVLFGMLAFAVDLGYILHARTELQRTADACVLAAAGHLPDESQAKSVAQAVAEDNYGTVGTDLDLSSIECGFWDRDTATFTTPPPQGRSVNAVRATLTRTEAAGNPLDLFFARLLGVPKTDVSASATAMYDRWLCGPFVGIQWVTVPGNPKTDSYDSRKGAYNGATAKDRGSVCSDGPVH